MLREIPERQHRSDFWKTKSERTNLEGQKGTEAIREYYSSPFPITKKWTQEVIKRQEGEIVAIQAMGGLESEACRIITALDVNRFIVKRVMSELSSDRSEQKR